MLLDLGFGLFFGGMAVTGKERLRAWLEEAIGTDHAISIGALTEELAPKIGGEILRQMGRMMSGEECEFPVELRDRRAQGAIRGLR